MKDRAPMLHWAGKPGPSPESSSSLRVVSGSDDRATLITGDNLRVMSSLGERLSGQVSLAYLDPPFLTGRTHAKVTRSRAPDGRILRKHSAAFDDRWDGLDHYLAALLLRLRAARELLAPHGCLVLHVDSKTSHYAKVLCDEIFGPEAFASEIVWRYRRWPSRTRNFQRVHDVLLRYVKDPDVPPRFRQLYEPLAASTVATWGDRKQRAVVDSDGRRARSSTTDEATPGTPLGDVWDIGIVAPVSRERTGYPTQKPEALLERLVMACTDPDDLVLDPYLGSGTTAKVALTQGRRIVGIDMNPDAVEITAGRIAGLCAKPRIERLGESQRALLPQSSAKVRRGPRSARRGPADRTRRPAA